MCVNAHKEAGTKQKKPLPLVHSCSKLMQNVTVQWIDVMEDVTINLKVQLGFTFSFQAQVKQRVLILFPSAPSHHAQIINH